MNTPPPTFQPTMGTPVALQTPSTSQLEELANLCAGIHHQDSRSNYSSEEDNHTVVQQDDCSIHSYPLPDFSNDSEDEDDGIPRFPDVTTPPSTVTPTPTGYLGYPTVPTGQHTLKLSKNIDIFLAQIYENLERLAKIYRIQINTKDKQWLQDHNGKFCEPAQSGSISEATATNPLRPRLLFHSASFRYSHLHNETKSTINYETFCRQLWIFLAFTGRYKSMFMLLQVPPYHCPSISPDDLRLFVLFKFLEKGDTICIHENSTDVLKDIYGNTILAIGTSRNHEGVLQVIPAIRHLHHKHRDHKEQFVEHCDACYDQLLNADPSTSVSTIKCSHCNEAHHTCHGNPCDDSTITGLKNQLSRLSRDRRYQVKSRHAIYPSELKSISLHVKSVKFEEKSLQHYVMILSTLHHASRFHGLYSATWRHFNEYTFAGCYLKNKGLLSVGQMLREKSDRQDYVYTIPFIDSHPHFCYLRHLLVYIHCFHQPGVLFHPPSDYTLDDWRETDLYKKNLDEWNDRKVFPFLCSPNLQELPAIIIDEQSDSVADQLHKKTRLLPGKKNEDYASSSF